MSNEPKPKKNKAIEILESELFFMEYKLKVPFQTYARIILQKEKDEISEALSILKTQLDK